MYSEARKLHLIEEVIKIKSDAVLTEIEAVVKKSMTISRLKKTSAHDFLGIISKKDIKLMNAAIEDGCEQINDDDWK
ncbi:hypothetical protein [Pedobacter cryoconitis]|uniref:Uncharacterized protein n=1 Tax=Pedobacter cryoconitis TaxID=188932 RepID=A0A327SS31_9SPHI|nr:hypothetical protein [Pedobacter cryoconitis]RAJ31731.1 hypothetical protein LY11_02231 [Pedobacter cryoconitis]